MVIDEEQDSYEKSSSNSSSTESLKEDRSLRSDYSSNNVPSDIEDSELKKKFTKNMFASPSACLVNIENNLCDDSNTEEQE